MAQQTKPKRRKAWKITSIVATSILMVSVIAIPTFLILDTAGAVSITSGVNRQYTMTFTVDEKVYATKTLYRGAKIDYSDIPEPVKYGSLLKYYTFSGWDITGDGYADILPSRAYRSYTAVAVFREHKL